MPEYNPPKGTRSKLAPKNWRRPRRVAAYQAPLPTRFRRAVHSVFNLWTLSLALVLMLGAFLTLTYYWFEFSDRIDRKLLSGEVYTPAAGIYSAPKILRAGEKTSMIELIDYLETAGYIEKNAKADASRSRYSVAAGKLIIEPGFTAVIDGKKAFSDIAVKFTKDGKQVETIVDTDTGSERQNVK